MSELVLASTSATRARLLREAGIAFRAVAPRVDEEALFAALKAENRSPGEAATALAEFKALSVARSEPDAWVLGCDQLLSLGQHWFQKPGDREGAADQLRKLSGATHELHTAAAIARHDEIVWRHRETSRLTMRLLSSAFLEDYLARAGEEVTTSVGAYRIEGLGAQLFDRIEGDCFAIQGLALLPLLAYLREIGLLAS